MDASAAGEGKLAFTLRMPIGVVGAISPFNFPLNLVAHKLAPAIAAGCPVVLKPASQTPLSAITLARHPARRVRPARRPPQRRDRRRRHGRQRDRRPPRHRADHVHRLARGRLGHPRPRRAQEGRPRARQQRAAHHRAERRRGDRREEGVGRRLLARGPVVHLDAAHLRARVGARAVPRRARPARGRARGRRSARRADRRVGAHLHRRPRPRAVVGRRSGRGAAPRSSRAARCGKTACSRRPCSAASPPT